MRLPLLVFAACTIACSAEPTDSADTDGPDIGVDTDPPAPNHKLQLYNYSGNLNRACAKQLQQLVLTPEGDGAPIVRSFLSNPGDESIEWVYISEIEDYRIEVVESPGGESIWWDGMALAPGGTTTIFVEGINTGFTENSRCNTIFPTGSTLVCVTTPGP